MKSSEVKNLKMIENGIIFDVNSKMYVEMIDIRVTHCSDDNRIVEAEKIKFFLGAKKLATLYDGYQYLSQLMLSNPSVEKEEVLVGENTPFISIFAKRANGMITVWHCKHSNYEANCFGGFPGNALVIADKPANLLDMVIDRPVKIVKEFLPEGGAFLGKHYVLDEDGMLFEENNDFWVRNPKVDYSIKRFFSPDFGSGVLSQIIVGNGVVSLLENGMLFNGESIDLKRTISEDNYRKLVSWAETVMFSWNSVITGDSFDSSELRNIHRDISPCLYY